MKTKLFTIACCTAIGILACNNAVQSGAGVRNEEAAAASDTGTFDLFTEANHVVDESCDRATKLILDTAQIKGKVAFLEEVVLGACEIFAVPNNRYYPLSQEDDGCGSIVYKGEIQTVDGVSTIEITDNRLRVCEDIIAALIVVKEVTPKGEVTRYSGTQKTPSASAIDPSDRYYGRFEAPDRDNACATDSQCITSGCSGEVCAAESLVTTCEVVPAPPGSCGCVNSECVWHL